MDVEMMESRSRKRLGLELSCQQAGETSHSLSFGGYEEVLPGRVKESQSDRDGGNSVVKVKN